MKSFDEYFNENFEYGLSDPSKYILKFTFEAGQQSKQTEVDELQKRIDTVLYALCERGKTKEHRIDQAYKILKGDQS